jgi:hypothetical protein
LTGSGSAVSVAASTNLVAARAVASLANRATAPEAEIIAWAEQIRRDEASAA